MSDRLRGSRRQKRNQRLLVQHGNVCHICGHPEAEAMDHVIPLAKGGADDETNLQPAHHQPCPTCGERCNLRKGTNDWAPIIKRSSSLDRP